MKNIEINEVEKNFLEAGIAIKKSLLTSEEIKEICHLVSKAHKDKEVNMPVAKDIELIEIYKNLNFRFRVEEEYYDLIMNPINEAFQGGIIITEDNKRILPVRIFKNIQFSNGEEYKITECNIEYQSGYIIMSLDIRFTGCIVDNNMRVKE